MAMINIPILLTTLRLFAIPVFVVLFYVPLDWAHVAAAVLFGAAGLTDWLDGYLARYWKQTTKFGAFLDPVVDKLMVAVALVLIISELHMPYLALPAAIIVGREIVVSALREWMAELGKRISIAVTMVAKFKTLVQMMAVVLLLLNKPHQHLLINSLGVAMLYLSAVLTLWSMMMYLKAAWPELTMSMDES